MPTPSKSSLPFSFDQNLACNFDLFHMRHMPYLSHADYIWLHLTVSRWNTWCYIAWATNTNHKLTEHKENIENYNQ
jgi:hypothetical protein